MRSFNFVVERDPDTGLFVGYVPGWLAADSQGDSLDEPQRNLRAAMDDITGDIEGRRRVLLAEGVMTIPE
jgi:predicted RNase H-like HicB family nuclease